MPSQNKLIKQGIKYTDSIFDEISRRLEAGVKDSDTLEEFLVKYHQAFPDKDNPLIAVGYDRVMSDLILSETNNHRFSRPSQKELVRVTIENSVGELIRDVGDDVRESVREVVKDGYNNNLSQDEIAVNISNKVSAIKGRRAKAIARTEIARTATISDYIINKERGATHFYVECRNTACPICKKAWHKGWTEKKDNSFRPSDSSAGGKGWIGDKVYSMNDTGRLPPIHPNCRCVPYFVSEAEIPKGATIVQDTTTTTTTTTTGTEPTKEQLSKNLTPAERAEYANYKRVIDNHTKWLKDNPNASPEQINNHKSKLAKAQKAFDELRRKALGGDDGDVKPTPKPEPTPKPKPKSTPKEPTTKKETKPKDNAEKLPNPTAKQLRENLTPLELKRYKRYLKEIKENKMSPEFIEMRKREVENFKRKALGLKPLEENKTILSENKPKETPKTKQTPKVEKPKSKPKKGVEKYNPFDKSKFLTKSELDKMDFKQLAKHHNAKYLGVKEYDYDGRKYHMFEQTFDNGETLTIYFEVAAVKSYTKKGIATPNEIVHEVFKVPEALRNQTNEIWFKNTTDGIDHRPLTKSRYDKLAKNEGGYNISHKLEQRQVDTFDDPDHRIVINASYFKGVRKGQVNFLPHAEDEIGWKHAIFHEFTHSGDTNRDKWRNKDLIRLCYEEEYDEIEKAEPYFTGYANRYKFESFAEHGGYIARMEANPQDHDKKIQIKVYENGMRRIKEITYDEYKEMYPKHYEYFMRKFKEGF